MSKLDPLEELADRYRREGWEVIVRPQPEELPPFFASVDIELLAAKNGEYRGIHSPQTATTSTTPPPISSGREPDTIHLRVLLTEAQRSLRNGALEAALLLTWSVIEACLREAVRQPGTAFLRPPMPRELIREAAQRHILSPADRAILESSWNLRTMVSHGLRPDVLPPEAVQSLIDIARRLTSTPPSEIDKADTSGLKRVSYGYGVRQPAELRALVFSANRVLSEVLASSASLISAEWDRTEDARGQSIVTLRLSDFTGAVTGTFAINELRSYPILRDRLNSLWGDLLQIRNHYQLQALGAEQGRADE
jgi:hypothetical protein